MKTKSTIKFASPVFIMQFVVLIHTWLTCTINPKRSSLVAIMVLSMCMVSFGANRYSVATGNWSSTSTWSATSGGAPGASVPTAGYFVYIEGGYTVTLDANAPAAGALRLLSINTGSELKTTAAYTVNATTITVNGYYFNGSTGTITGTMSVNNGATYEHAVDNATIPTATWGPNSLCLISGVTGSSNDLTTVVQTFGNFTWNCPGQTAGNSLPNANYTIAGTLTITNTGSSTVQLVRGSYTGEAANYVQTGGSVFIGSGNTATKILTVDNDFTISGGTFDMDNANPPGASTFTLNVGGDFTDNGGTFTMTASSNSTCIENFNGTGTQTIGGSQPITFHNLTINNTFATADQIKLNTFVAVDYVLTLTSGILNPNGNTFILAPGATTTIGSASSYIDGIMSYTINTTAATTLNFPIGNAGDYRPVSLALKYSTAHAHTYTAQLYDANANSLGFAIPGTLNLVSNVHYYKITASTNPPTNLTSANLTIYYSTTNGANDGVADHSNLGIAKSTLLASPWIDISPAGGGTADGTGSITSVAFTSFNSYFTLANRVPGGNPLPIELLFFKAACENNTAKLNWATASETNNDFFSVEKSHNGTDFENISNMPGAGNSNNLLNYCYSDGEPYSDISYYRLKQTDFNGNYTYSDIVSTSCSKGNSLSMIVTSSYNYVNLFITPGNSTNLTLSIFDVSGRMVYNKDVNTFITDNPLSISSDIFSSGIYIFRLHSESESIMQKVMIR